jgi:3-phenylpropionate/cinnamic acid dioxygenase small subunit
MSAPETSRPALDPVLLAEVSALLFHEAELLDDRRFDEWLELFTEDAVYWIPQSPDTDPRHDVQLLLDDRRRMHERVLRLSSGFAYSQDPASRTVHLVGNVVVLSGPGDAGELVVSSVQTTTEVRRGRQMVYTARVRHTLVPDGDGGGRRIARKEVRLANGDLPLGNVTFLL